MKPIPEQIQGIRGSVNGYKMSQVLMSAEQLGVFESMSNGLTRIHDIASDLGVAPQTLSLLLNVLTGNGFMMKEGEDYRFSEDYSTLNPKHAASQNGYIQYAREVRDRWLGLTDSVLGADVGTQNFAEITGGDEAATRAFMAAMHANAHPQAAFIAQEYDFSGHRILDLGAGTGIYSIRVTEKYDSSSALLFDLPEVAPITQEYVGKSQASQRLHVVAADYHDSLPSEEFDDLFMFAVVHQESDDGALALLKKAYNVLKPGGRLFLTSFFLNDGRTDPPFSVMFAVEMLVMVAGGKAYTHSEIVNLLKAVSFTSIERVDKIPGPATLYTAAK